ncbi:N-acyl homoserine lactonase family protein [Paraburkholderia sp. JPY465]|uniref:N-acyl homoserine lactonase family protein n=1 Tax=Paraburkholderia sp. JPY465 TaxID=3042285 RepID=UPI003D1ECBA0
MFALRYATNPKRRTVSNFLSNADLHDGPMPMDYFVWLAVNDTHAVVIDSGMTQAACEARGHTFLCDPVAGLAQLGVAPEKVAQVVVTHLHYDHAGNLDKFPNAHFHIHPAELGHACGPYMQHASLRRPYRVDQICTALRLLYGDRLHFTAESTEIVPGITSHWVGGHTPGMQVVRVLTERGMVVLASDAMHYYANLERRNPFPILVDTLAYITAWDQLLALADSVDHIVAGHDPKVMALYPNAAPDRPGFAVRLDLPPVA